MVRARAWTSGTTNPLAIYAEVKRGDYPILGAKVEVSVIRPGLNGSNEHREKFDLLDTGSGGQYIIVFIKFVFSKIITFTIKENNIIFILLK